MDNVLIEKVYLPAFVKCCNDNGVTDPQAIQGLLETAALYRVQEQGSQTNQIKRANQALREQLGGAEQEAPVENEMSKSAADALKADAEVRNALAALLKK